jgi:hypothetical protein
MIGINNSSKLLVRGGVGSAGIKRVSKSTGHGLKANGTTILSVLSIEETEVSGLEYWWIKAVAESIESVRDSGIKLESELSE